MPKKKGLPDEVQVRLELQGDMAQKFNRIKKRLGQNSNAEVVRYLIAMEFERISSGRT